MSAGSPRSLSLLDKISLGDLSAVEPLLLLSDGDGNAEGKGRAQETPTGAQKNAEEEEADKGLFVNGDVREQFTFWVDFAPMLVPFLDVFSLLCLRMCTTYLFVSSWHFEVLDFSDFRGFDPRVLTESVLPSLMDCVAEDSRIACDLSTCTLLEDLNAVVVAEALQYQLVALHLDFCYLITDRGLEALLLTPLPYLQRLSMRGCRNPELIGEPFVRALSVDRWPEFRVFDCSFTKVWLEHVEWVAEFISMRERHRLRLRRLKLNRSSSEPAELLDQYQAEQEEAGGGREDLEESGTGIGVEGNHESTVPSIKTFGRLPPAAEGSRSPRGRGEKGKRQEREGGEEGVNQREAKDSPRRERELTSPSQQRQTPRKATHRRVRTLEYSPGLEAQQGRRQESQSPTLALVSGGEGDPSSTGQEREEEDDDEDEDEALETPDVIIVGSWASRSLLEKHDLSPLVRQLTLAVSLQVPDVILRVAKKVYTKIHQVAKKSEQRRPRLGSVLLQMQKRRGHVLVVNIPFSSTVLMSVAGLGEDRAGDGDAGGSASMSAGAGGLHGHGHGHGGEREAEGVPHALWTYPLSAAIQRRDFPSMQALLAMGAASDAWDFLGKSALCSAVELGEEAMVDLLLECGAEVNPPDLLGPSPLLAAVKSHQVGILKKLIDAGARLNYSAPHLKLYRSPLFVACVERCPEVISVTLDSGGDPSWADPAWYTPTLLAYQLNSDWLPRFLDAGAGSTFRQRWVLTDVLTCGILKGDLTCVTLLVARYPDLVFLPHKLWSLPLIQAARLGKLSILRFLLENGAPVDALAGHLGEAALHAAASEGYVECVEALLRAGADVDRKRRDGLTALHIACLEDRKQLAELLLDFGADANTYDLNSGETPLISTILARNEAMGLILLKKKEKGKLDPNMQDSGGRSALSFALYFGMLKCAQQLLVEGADVTLKDETGATPHDIMLDRLRKQGIQRRLCGTIERLKRNRDREIGQDKASQMRKEREKKRSGIRRETSGDLSSSDFTPMAPRGQWGSGCPCPLSIFSCSNGNGNVGGVQSRSGKQKDANSRPEGGRMFEEGARGGAVVFSESAGVGMDFRSSDFHSFRFQRETGGTPDGGTTA